MCVRNNKFSWLMLAIASGICAACNGVFAKLTTTELTASWSSSIAQLFGLNLSNKVIEFAIRALFFGLNLLFNAIMWGIFTRALTLASSTVRVSIINTSSNFIVTALLSLMIFGESLPGLWWLGALMLVVGSVIMGQREDVDKKDVVSVAGEPLLPSPDDAEAYRDDEERVELNTATNSEDEDGDEDSILR